MLPPCNTFVTFLTMLTDLSWGRGFRGVQEVCMRQDKFEQVLIVLGTLFFSVFGMMAPSAWA
jgi:hypothetical protein